jgi:hypothetical protein
VTSTTYATLAEFVAAAATARLNATSNAKHQQMLDTAARMVDLYTRNRNADLLGTEAFTASASATRTYDHVLRNGGKLEIDDLIGAPTAVTIGGTSITPIATYITGLPENPGNGPYTALQFRYDTTNIMGAGNAWYWNGIGVGQIAVTGVWGFCTQANRPPEIKEATLLQAVRLYELANLGKDNMVQMALAGGSLPAIDPQVAIMLKPFRRYGSTGGVHIG